MCHVRFVSWVDELRCIRRTEVPQILNGLKWEGRGSRILLLLPASSGRRSGGCPVLRGDDELNARPWKITSAVRSRERLKEKSSVNLIEIGVTAIIGSWLPPSDSPPFLSASSMDAPAAFRTLTLSWNGITWDFSRRWRSEGSLPLPWVRHFHAWIGALEVVVGKCNAYFRDSTQLGGFISLRDGYRDLCRPWQFVHLSMIDDLCCVQASVHSAFRNVTLSMHFWL